MVNTLELSLRRSGRVVSVAPTPTIDPDGIGYVFDFVTGSFFIYNADQSAWHELSIVGEQLVIGDAASTTPDSSVHPTGPNFEFSTGPRFRLKDDLSAFREIYASAGAFSFSSPGTASAALAAAVSPGALYKFESNEFYLYDEIDLIWLQVRVTGAVGLEQLTLG